MANQTISQALRRIKKLKGQLGEHRAHAAAGVSFISTAAPAYAFGPTREEAVKVAAELVMLQTNVAVANATTEVEFDGRKAPLAWAVRMLRELAAEIAWVKALSVKAQESVIEEENVYDLGRVATVSKAYTCSLPEAKRNALASDLQDRFDRLNDVVETANHKTHIPTL